MDGRVGRRLEEVMSIWTHINGVIRIDNICGDDAKAIRKVKKILGPIDSSSKPKKETPKNITLPRGSEGSLDYTITPLYNERPKWNYKKKKYWGKEREFSGMLIAFHGDLRDFGKESGYSNSSQDTKYLVNWFRTTVDKLEEDFLIRQGMLLYEAEDEENGWLLQVISGTNYRLSEVVRIMTPVDGALRGV